MRPPGVPPHGTPLHPSSLQIRFVEFPALTNSGYQTTVLEGAPPLPFKGGLLRSNAAKFPLPSSLRTSALSARPERIRRRPLSVISNSLYFFVPSTHDFFAFPGAASATAASAVSIMKVNDSCK